jgi:outer membrane receptor protein involved in Fe transport
LFSNFTFFLDDPINGDQIKQKEDRSIFGFNSQFEKQKNYGDVTADYTTGFGLRYDIVDDIELSHTLNRKTVLNYKQLGNLRQTNAFSFFKSEFEIGKFKIAPEVRLDYFKFIYEDLLQENYTISAEEKSIISPKLNFFFNKNENSQWFLKTGMGFHSNDTRVVVNQKGKDILPKVYGVDLGNIWKPNSKLIVNSALWYLLSDQEFVYVGDAGIVEPNGKSERFGVDLGFRLQMNDYLYVNADATYTHARSVDKEKGQNYIPLAPGFTMSGGISLKEYNKFSGGVRFKYLDNRPANEDNSIVAKGYFVTDASVTYSIKENMNIGMSIENLFDVAWNETQFATESRLQNESQPVEEIHFTPGTPFNFKTTISYTF